jgi:outer membrane protein assembly factor BamB
MRWVVPLPGPSFPVVANGRVFVTAMDSDGSIKNALYALDELTGSILWGPVPLGGIPIGDAGQKESWSAPALDGNRVFVVNVVGKLRAFAQETGALLWESTIPGTGTEGLFASTPVAVGGIVYVAPEGGKIYGFDEATGAQVWSASANARRFVAPAIFGSTLFVSAGCSSAQAVALSTGALLWTGSSNCPDAFSAGIIGGGGAIPVYSSGRLYARSVGGAGDAFGWVYDATNGSALYAFDAGPAPVATDKLTYLVRGGDVQAVAPGGTSPAWAFRGYDVYVPPIVVGDTIVLAATPYGLWVLDALSGTVRGHAAQPDPLDGNEANFNRTEQSLAAADGMLFVPTIHGLSAY